MDVFKIMSLFHGAKSRYKRTFTKCCADYVENGSLTAFVPLLRAADSDIASTTGHHASDWLKKAEEV